MECVYCAAKTRVSNSRYQRRSNQVWRRRHCTQCGAIFTTHEAVDLSATLSVRKAQKLSPFVTDQLFTEVLLALQDRKDPYKEARELTATIISKLRSQGPEIKSTYISQATALVLKRFDRRAWLRFVAEHPSIKA